MYHSQIDEWHALPLQETKKNPLVLLFPSPNNLCVCVREYFILIKSIYFLGQWILLKFSISASAVFWNSYININQILHSPTNSTTGIEKIHIISIYTNIQYDVSTIYTNFSNINKVNINGTGSTEDWHDKTEIDKDTFISGGCPKFMFSNQYRQSSIKNNIVL